MAVNCSGDIDTFEMPTYTITGTSYENTCVIKELSFTGVSYTNILNAAVSACTNASTCLSSVTWSLMVKEDSEVVYDASTGTTEIFWTGYTATGNTPTDSALTTALDIAFITLGYDYSNTGMNYYIRKPYGVTLLEVNACLDIELSDGAGPCTGGTCSITCINMASQTYPTLSAGSDSVYVINDEAGVDSIELTVLFNGHIFDAPRNGKFRYELFKYNEVSDRFAKPIVYTDGWYDKSDITANSITETIPVSNLKLDGDYIMKGYWQADVITEYRSELGDVINTSYNTAKAEAARYVRDYDGYFIVNYSASTPVFSLNGTGYPTLGALRVISLLPDGTTDTFRIGGDISGDVMVALNGITMAKNLDYTISASTISAVTSTYITFLDPIISGDVITYSYASDGMSNRFKNDNIIVTASIISGATSAQGSNNPYYNTTEGKYEIYASLTPVDSNELYVTINGVTIANNIDYYQSITNPKRMILEGDIYVNDVINIYYMSYAEVNGDIWFQPQQILWTISRPPQAVNGLFTVQVSEDTTFTTITQTATTEYVIGKLDYRADISFSGTVGQTYYYRIKNNKNYLSMCGDIISSESFSEIVPIIVRVNSINSY
jgi:hypothetical protein